jgi:NAD(P)-dependent dehydrogenase (short-subunit alcohol dehydrogenase family)
MWSPSRAPWVGWRSSTTVSRPRAGTPRWRPIDLTDDNAIAHLCRSIHDRWGKADIWVHAAIHVTALTPAPHIQVKDLDRVLATNIRMLARLIANVEPLIAPAEAPQAVFFDDAWDEKFAGAYAMSKAAQRALVESPGRRRRRNTGRRCISCAPTRCRPRCARGSIPARTRRCWPPRGTRPRGFLRPCSPAPDLTVAAARAVGSGRRLRTPVFLER